MSFLNVNPTKVIENLAAIRTTERPLSPKQQRSLNVNPTLPQRAEAKKYQLHKSFITTPEETSHPFDFKALQLRKTTQ